MQDKLDLVLSELAAIREELESPQVTATFCISQARGADLAAQWAIGMPLEFEIGPGWADGPDVKATYAPFAPGIIPLPFGIPFPNEAGISLGASLGRGVDICVDMPIDLADIDQDLLSEMAKDINSAGSLTRNKYQRRAAVLLNYASRRIPGIQNRRDTASDQSVTASYGTTDNETEFDTMDSALDNIFMNGFEPQSNGLGIFKDSNVVAIASSFELPSPLQTVLDTPENIFFPFENRNFNNLTCDELGFSSLKILSNGFSDLCQQLDQLPNFSLVKNSFGKIDTLKEDLLAAFQVFTAIDSGSSSERKGKFCSSTVGQRDAFDQYCNRQ